MAGTTTSSRPTAVAGSDLKDLIVQFQAVVDDLETLRAALDAVCDLLDADGGVTGTTYASTADVAAASAMTAAKIGDLTGTAVS